MKHVFILVLAFAHASIAMAMDKASQAPAELPQVVRSPAKKGNNIDCTCPEEYKVRNYEKDIPESGNPQHVCILTCNACGNKWSYRYSPLIFSTTMVS